MLKISRDLNFCDFFLFRSIVILRIDKFFKKPWIKFLIPTTKRVYGGISHPYQLFPCSQFFPFSIISSEVYLKPCLTGKNVNNRKTGSGCEICSKSIIKTPERRLVSLLLTLNIFHTLFHCFYC